MESQKVPIPAEEARAAEPANTAASDMSGRKLILSMLLTVCSGLLLGLVYLGGRISATHAATAQAAPANPKPAALVIRPPAEAVQFAERAAAGRAPAEHPPAEHTKVSPFQPAAAPVKPAAKPALVALAVPPAAKPVETARPAALTATPPPQPRSAAPLVVATNKLPAPIQLPAEAPTRAFHGELARPKAGDAYLQVGAMGSPYAERWVGVLQQRGYHPIVVEGPSSEIFRVLLGPLGPAEVPEVEAKLRQAGIEHFEKVY